MDFGYYSLCYHYVRDGVAEQRVPNLLGVSVKNFERQVKIFKKKFTPIGIDEVINYSYNGYSFQGKPGLLITFDDGLSDHYQAAKILADEKVRAIFFIPTCILTENLPANPIIIHYVLSLYRIAGLLAFYHDALKDLEINPEPYNVVNTQGNPWSTISAFKHIINYRFDHHTARAILLLIYQKSLANDYEDPLALMHVTAPQINEILEMGHMVGVHSHTHPSIASANLSSDEFAQEVKKPREILESTFDIKVDTLSYPFGGVRDCFTPKQLKERDATFKLAFTVEEMRNTHSTNPLALGRYMPHSTDTAQSIINKLTSFS